MKILNYTLNERQENVVNNIIAIIDNEYYFIALDRGNKESVESHYSTINTMKKFYLDYTEGIVDTINDDHIVSTLSFKQYYFNKCHEMEAKYLGGHE